MRDGGARVFWTVYEWTAERLTSDQWRSLAWCAFVFAGISAFTLGLLAGQT